MDTEIRDLTRQRDLAQSRLQEMLQSSSDNQVSKTSVGKVILFEILFITNFSSDLYINVDCSKSSFRYF